MDGVRKKLDQTRLSIFMIVLSGKCSLFFFAMLLNKTAPIKLRVQQSTFTPDDPSPNTHSNYWLKYINPPYDQPPQETVTYRGNAHGKRKEICGQRETD